jgi:hypothetical protein
MIFVNLSRDHIGAIKPSAREQPLWRMT